MITEIVSHYKVLSKLGAGGMGEVYLAEDTRLGRKVALKFLPASYQYDPERRDRFLREARAASALRSPNVAAIYDIGEHEHAMFIAMEYVEGELLSDKLEHGPLSVQQAVDIAIQVAEALEEAHSLAIVHRDIKSSNLIVAGRGLVKVLDFGLAKRLATPDPGDDRTAPLGKETSPGVILGTVSYMSPEQALGHEIDARTDLFSLGVLLYEMLTGRQPFEGGTTGELLVAILNKEPLPLSHYSAEIPAEMQWIVTKALRKDKTLRYQSARDFIVDLKNIGHGLKTVMLDRSSDSDSALPTTAVSTREHKVKKDSGARGRRRKSVDSIAVLPLENSSNDPEIEYLIDGITESVINTLSRLPKLRVMARSTVFRYKGRDIDPLQAGAELNVRAVMTGRLRQIGDHFSIGAELVDVQDGAQLWGEQYSRNLSGIVTLQDEISADIAEKLKLKLTSDEKKKIPARRRPARASAYELYLKGRYHWGKWTKEGFQNAISFFEQALGKDPEFAYPYSGLADVFGVLSYLNPDPSESQGAMLRAKAFAMRALELDDTLPESHLTLANIAHLHDWDWPQAEREFKLALELNPNLAAAHQGYALFLMDQRKFDEAIKEMEVAVQIDPLSFPISTAMGYLLFCAERYDEATIRLRSSADLDPELQLTHQVLGACLERSGHSDEAIVEYLKIIPTGARGTDMVELLKRAYADSGITGFWLQFTAFVNELSEQRHITPFFVTIIYAALKEVDAAFEWLEKAFAERLALLSHIHADPRFSPLWSDERFGQLLRRMGVATEVA